jgi:hypothetical protein
VTDFTETGSIQTDTITNTGAGFVSDHALVLAEGVPAETFVDKVTRMGFDNWAEHEAPYGDEPTIPEMPYPRVQSRRQLPLEIRAQMDDRARQLTAASRGLLAA